MPLHSEEKDVILFLALFESRNMCLLFNVYSFANKVTQRTGTY